MNTTQIKHLITAIGQGLYEKEEAIRLAVLCALAGENMFMIGLPGTAKSMISRRIASAFQQLNYFEYLMNEFSTPDEIFGSVKLKGLDEGIYEKNTDGYLPQAHIAFLDEIWKSGPAILNTLLTIINEKKFHNGNQIQKVPLHMLISASNELPKEKAGLEALYDRFILRLAVSPVKDTDNFFRLCENSSEEITIDPKLQLDITQVRAWQTKIDTVSLPADIQKVILDIRKEMERLNTSGKRSDKDKFYVSDRRWKKIIHLLKTSAFACGRNEVDLMDCQLIAYCIWNTDQQRQEAQQLIRKIALENACPCDGDITPITEEIDLFAKAIEETFYVYNERKTKTQIISKKDKHGDTYYKTDHSRYKWVHPSIMYSNSYAYGSDTDLKEGKGKMNVDVSNYSLDDRTISLRYDGNVHILTQEVEVQKQGLAKNPAIFDNPRAYEATRATFEKEHKQVFDHINREIKRFTQLKRKQDQLYRQNLFADPQFSELLLKRIDEMITQLEDQLVALNKQQARYDK